MKKWFLFSVCVMVLGGCQNTKLTTTDSSGTIESSGVSKSESKTDIAKANAGVILGAILSDNVTGFKRLQGETYDDFLDTMASNIAHETASEFEPVDQFSIPYDESTIFTPYDLIYKFKLTQAKVLQNIDTYTIESVDLLEDGDVAEIKFKSKGIATKDLANAITLIRSNLFDGGLGESWYAQHHENEDVKKANTLLNYYLYYLAFDKKSVDVSTTDMDQEFTLYLERSKGKYILTDDSYTDLVRELNVMEYSSN